MKYDFTTLMDRRGKDAIAVDLYDPKDVKHGLDVIPMWVADMNFPTLPDISEAMIERAKHPAFGYFQPRPEYYEHIINWHQERYGTEGLKKEDILYANGVLGGVVSALNVLCQAVTMCSYSHQRISVSLVFRKQWLEHRFKPDG